MVLNFGDIDGLTEEELYERIDKSSNYKLSKKEIKALIDIIKDTTENIDKKQESNVVGI